MSDNYQKEYWLNRTKTADELALKLELNPSWDEAKGRYNEVTPILPEHLEIIKAETKMGNVVDFGVGMARNYDYLSGLFANAYGFDTVEMVKRLRIYKPYITNIIDDFNLLKQIKFDVLYESTVFQHLPPKELTHYLSQLSYTTKFIVSHTRSYNDFERHGLTGGINMIKLIGDIGCYSPIHCSIPLNLAEFVKDETHYHILYKSKNL